MMRLILKIRLLLLLPLVLLGIRCQDKSVAPPPRPLPQMPVLEVKAGTYTGYSTYPANIEGKENIEIRAKVSGYIQEIYVDEGELVKKGSRLFKLETATMTQDADAAKSAIKTAEAQVETAKLEVERLEPLVAKEVISEVRLSTAKANLSAAQSQLEQAKGVYQSINASISYANITSPVDGMIGHINLRQGSLVGPTTLQAITTVSHIDQVYAYFAMNEGDYLGFAQKLKGKTLKEKLESLPDLTLTLANGAQYEHPGRVNAAAGDIDPATGAIRLRAVFKNPDGILRNGSSGTISIPKVYSNQVAIPSLSTFEQQGKTMVYIVGQGDTLKAKPVNVREDLGNILVLDDGLSVGERILATGVAKVRAGTVIRPQPMSMDSVIQSFETIFR